MIVEGVKSGLETLETYLENPLLNRGYFNNNHKKECSHF
jgi:hypothetical protein